MLTLFLSVSLISSYPLVEPSDETALLKQLWEDYQTYGLPTPPAESYLAQVPEPGMRVSNGVREQDTYLVLVTKKGEPLAKSIFWVGCAPARGWSGFGFALKEVKPTPQAMQGTKPVPNSFRSRGNFPTYPDLALAIQCYGRGWNDVALVLLTRHRQQPVNSDDWGRPPDAPTDPRAALAELAWNYWCNRFAAEKGDRGHIPEKLQKISTAPYGFNKALHLHIIADMTTTLKRSTAAPGSLDEALDRLIDLKTDGSWPGSEMNDERTYADWDENYRKLSAAGLDAVPVLLKHINDFRLTRCIDVTREGDYHWHIRIADVVALRLRQLAGPDLRYDFLRLEGRGVRIDSDHAQAWAAETTKKDEKNFLLQRVMKSERGEVRVDDAMLKTLAQKYPDDFLKLWRENVGKENNQAYAFVAALEESKVPKAVHDELLLAAAKSDNSWWRYHAAFYLTKHPEGPKLVISWLEALPKTPMAAYWQAPVTFYAQVAAGFNDERVWETLAKTAKRVDLGQRLEILDKVSGCSQRGRLIAFYRQFLDDSEERTRRTADFNLEDLFSGPGAGFTFTKLKVRDFAALKLGSVFKISSEPDSTWTDADWKAYHGKIADALKEYDKEKKGKETRP